ncbi:hypothetical protein FHW71_003732 [Enterobacter sp. Sphag1F]|jgi:hypothetical protein|nr:hypothetical protein [Enterobacter sp. Sphag1F]NYI15532.1 hypothetical protein [Enterobacter sp. Sphag71]
MANLMCFIALYENGDGLAISKIRSLHRNANKHLIKKIFNYLCIDFSVGKIVKEASKSQKRSHTLIKLLLLSKE